MGSIPTPSTKAGGGATRRVAPPSLPCHHIPYATKVSSRKFDPLVYLTVVPRPLRRLISLSRHVDILHRRSHPLCGLLYFGIRHLAARLSLLQRAYTVTTVLVATVTPVDVLQPSAIV